MYVQKINVKFALLLKNVFNVKQIINLILLRTVYAKIKIVIFVVDLKGVYNARKIIDWIIRKFVYVNNKIV